MGEATGAGPVTILLVEDDEVDRIAVRRRLSKMGDSCALEEAGSVGAAIERLDAGGIDLLLIDHKLPDGTGLDVQSKAGGLPCIFLTGTAALEDAVQAMQAGAYDYLIKDGQSHYVEVLPTVIAATLQRHRDAEELRTYRERLESLVDERTGELRRQNQFLDAIYRGSGQGLFVVDVEHGEAGPIYRYAGFNPTHEKATGITNEQVVGRSPAELTSELGEETVKEILRLYDRCADGEQLEIEHQVDFPRPGEWWLSRLSPVRDEQGQVCRIVGSGTIITEQKQVRAQLAQADRLATVGLLASGVAHEINNPLTYLLYNLDKVVELLPAPESSRSEMCELADQALEGASRIRDIVKDLRTFARVDEARQVPVPLHEVLRGALNMARSELKYRARLVSQLEPVPPVIANDGKLAQVFLNLLINACHAIEEGAVEDNAVTIRTWVEGDHVCGSVSDTGCGIPEATLPRLFDPFFTTKPLGEGSGLGLAICKNIVEASGGQIEVESVAGKGTTFLVRLPLGQQQPEPARNEPTSGGRRGRVLVIDDEPQVAQALKGVIGLDHDVEVASGGAAAQALLAGDRAFDAILCDLMMPNISGAELHQWVAERWPEVAERMVFITGGVFTPRAREFLERVDNLRLEKPVTPALLRSWIRKLIR